MTLLERIISIANVQPAPRWPQINEVWCVERNLTSAATGWRKMAVSQDVKVLCVRENPYYRQRPIEPTHTVFVASEGWCYDCVFTTNGRLIAYDLWAEMVGI